MLLCVACFVVCCLLSVSRQFLTFELVRNKIFEEIPAAQESVFSALVVSLSSLADLRSFLPLIFHAFPSVLCFHRCLFECSYICMYSCGWGDERGFCSAKICSERFRPVDLKISRFPARKVGSFPANQAFHSWRVSHVLHACAPGTLYAVGHSGACVRGGRVSVFIVQPLGTNVSHVVFLSHTAVHRG